MGPVYKKLRSEGNRLVLSFDSVGAGLECRGAKLTGFTIAGSDRKFYPADAEIRGDTVVVSSPNVERPVAVRLWLGKLPGGQSLEQGRPAGHAFPHRHLARRHPEVRITIRLDHAYAVQVSDGRPFQARRFTEEPVPAFVKCREPRKVFPRCRSRHRNTAVSHSRLSSAIWPTPIRPTFRSRGQPKSFRMGLDRGPRLWPIAAIS